MAQVILFPSQNISSDAIPDPLLTLNINKIEDDDIQLNVFLLLNGSTLVINLKDINISNLGLEYSINGIDYQSSSTFEINSPGDYTAYVRDKFSCLKQKNFTIQESEKRQNYLNISKANAINFVQVKELDNVDSFRNEDNLFQYENLVNFPYSENLLFNKKDKPALQIKSNRDKLQVFLRYEDSQTEEILMYKKSNNLNVFSKLDCKVYSYMNSKLAIYFDSGNEYDENGDVKSEYELNGNLPIFAKIGGFIEVGGFGLFEVSNIILDSSINKKVVIFEETYVGEAVDSVATSIYDLLNYNIYEHYFNLTNLKDGLYDIYIKASDSDNNNVLEYLSENIHVLDEHYGTLSIHYYEDNNKDLFYQYDLINQLRVEYSDITRFNVEENEININDNIANSIKSSLNFGDRFLFEDLTTKQLDTMSIALSSESVFINGIGYIKNGSLNIEKQERTNIYSLEVEMLKTNVELNLTNPRLSLLDYLIPRKFPLI